MLDKLALDKEKRDLLQENTQLRAVLKQYLDGTIPHCYLSCEVPGFLPSDIFACEDVDSFITKAWFPYGRKCVATVS